MENLSGFRLPHFSEDLAWLPPWLQPHKVNEYIKDQNPSEQTFEEMFFPPPNTSTGEGVKMSSREEARYKSFRLFLSAEDNSPLNFTQSSDNVVRFQLHLSPTGDSESMPSLLLDTSQSARFESNQTLVMRKLESSAPQEEKSDHLVSRSLGNNNNNGVKNEKNVRFLKFADINDAVELCISASEAPIIREVMKSESASKSLLASTALEVALRVRQARLEGFDEVFHSSNDEINDDDYLSDLDESSMEDAYEDLGLSVTIRGDLRGCDSNTSHVKDTCASEDYALHAKLKYKDLEGLEVDSGDTKQQSKGVKDTDIQLKNDLTLESLDGDGKKPTDDQELGLETLCVAFDGNGMLHQFVHASPAASMTEKIDLVMKDVTATPIQATFNSSKAKSSEHTERDDNLTKIVPDRFQSRWFGGWAWKKEVDASASVKHNNVRSIRDFFVGETSFLSESADIAPDENSFVDKHDRGTNMVSQSSVPFDGSRRKVDEEILFPSPSFVDSLCSVVSCSISSENGCSTLPQNNKDKTDTRNCFIPTTKHDMNNVQKTSTLNTEFVCGERLAHQVTSGDSSQPTVRRRVTSLGIYSMLLPSCGPYLEKESTFPDSSFPVKRTGGCISMNEMTNCEETAKDELDYRDELFQSKNLQKVETDGQVPARKRVRFSEPESHFPQKKSLQKLQATTTTTTSYRNCSSTRTSKKSRVEEVKRHLMKCRDKDLKKRVIIFQNIDFLLTGFTSNKEKEIEGLIRKHGGNVLSNIPFPTSRGKRISKSKQRQSLPVILCSKKLQTTKFLYGCAVNASILKVNWLTDSIGTGSLLPTDKYLILPNRTGEKYKIGKPVLCHNHQPIFDSVGIMLHGKPNFCMKMAKVVKHGGGLVFKTLHWLVNSIDNGKIFMGTIVTEDECQISRHLKQCALERKIIVVPISWIVKTLHVGRLIPFPENNLF